jgi:uncharacterized OB-fold protein
MTESVTTSYLPAGLPVPQPESDGLSAPYWEGAKSDKLVVQRCRACGAWQWGPEWICHKCLSFDMGWEACEPVGRIYSWERSHHPVHAALKGHGAYISVLVELPHADNVRMVGNLLGDPMQVVTIGAEVEAVFEHHDGDIPYTLVQWRVK